jgi:phosphoserine phosphatase RsbU/P
LQANARRPLAEQAAALAEALQAYQGSTPQRDDITVLSFRLD